jgi:CheY-like chemotaxis protein
VKTDKNDYAPGETAVITGTGFQAGEVVTLQVVHTEGAEEVIDDQHTHIETEGEGHEPWDVTADASGSISTTWYVHPDDSLGATFLLTAKGGTSGLTAQHIFTDGPMVLEGQCKSITLQNCDSGSQANPNPWVDGNLKGWQELLSGSLLSKYSLRAVASQLTRVLLTQTRAVTHKSSEIKLRCADEETRMNGKAKNTILIAEDNPDSRELLRVFLEGEGYNVIEAKNGAEAVILARQRCPDLILTDLHMPELDGTAAVKQIRGIDKLREIPIIAMSGDGLRGMEFFINTDEFGSGYIHYLTKPLNLDEMMEEINNLLTP